MLKLVKGNSFYSGLRLVVLNKPYDSWNNPETGEIFVKMVSLKLQGYLSRHIYGSLPVDTTDFIGTHILICSEADGSLRPISGFKIITDTCCRIHQLPFLARSLAQAAGATEHARLIDEIVCRSRGQSKDVSYLCSWTTQPEVRDDRDRSNLIKDIIASTIVNFHLDQGITDLIAAGVPRMKTNRFLTSVGFNPLAILGLALPNFRHSGLLGEEVVMMHLSSFTEKAMKLAQDHHELWRARVTIAGNENQVAKAA